MRFVFLANPASVHTRRWADGLRARGHEVLVVSNNEGRRSGLLKLARWLRLQVQVRRAMRRPGTLLMVHWIPAGIRALALLGIHPRVGVVWGSDIYLTTRGTRRLAIRADQQSLFLRGCDAVIATSVALADAAVVAGAPAARTAYVSFGVDTDRFSPGPGPVELRSRLGLGTARVVLSSRAIAPIYNQLTVVDAMARLPSDTVVLMSGRNSDPAEVDRVSQRARSLGVSNRLQVISDVDDRDMVGLYRLADVVVSVPSSDGGASTILEAMACGRQIVATDLESVRHWLSEIDPGALVPVGDPVALADAIMRALTQPDAERRELEHRARAAVERRADQRTAFLAIERLHDQLVRGSPASNG